MTHGQLKGLASIAATTLLYATGHSVDAALAALAVHYPATVFPGNRDDGPRFVRFMREELEARREEETGRGG